jgi:ABC-type dipeptide/oligopeptide/nickel transport system permease component
MAVVLLGVSLFVFMILYLRGDPIQFLVPVEFTSPELLEQIREEMGFDDPLYIQYLRFLGKALRGDFGKSFQMHEPALKLVLERVPATFQLGSIALIFSLIIGVPAGVVAAVRRNSLADYIATWMGTFGRAVPNFWLGVLLILVFGVWMQIVPISGRGTWQHLILPAITLGFPSSATQVRLVRSSMLEVLGQDYIRTARSKGLSERVVIFKHALRNALIPVVTMLGMQVAWIFGGSIIVEQIFAWPGLGRLTVNSIFRLDMPIVQVSALFIAFCVTTMMLVVDITYVFIDPRIAYD